MKYLLHGLLYLLITFISFCIPFLWMLMRMRTSSRGTYIYKFFPYWLRRMIEVNYAFWK